MVIVFQTKPSILAGGVVAGPLEKRSTFKQYFDAIYEDERWQFHRPLESFFDGPARLFSFANVHLRKLHQNIV